MRGRGVLGEVELNPSKCVFFYFPNFSNNIFFKQINFNPPLGHYMWDILLYSIKNEVTPNFAKT